MGDELTPLGLFIQWLALVGLICHLVALVWGCKRCWKMTQKCPFSPSTRRDAGKVGAWEQMHPGHLSPAWSDQPRRRQGRQEGADSKGLTNLIKAKAKGTSRKRD